MNRQEPMALELLEAARREGLLSTMAGARVAVGVVLGMSAGLARDGTMSATELRREVQAAKHTVGRRVWRSIVAIAGPEPV